MSKRRDPRDQGKAPNRGRGDLIGIELGGHYRITGRLGGGGAGHVYLGVQEPLGRQVAIKVLRDDLNQRAEDEFEGRFLREAGAAASLRHPNVVVVYDFGSQGKLRYVVMEHLKGERLTDLIERGAVSELLTAEIAAGVARGLRHAHKAGLVHRDIKPGNIMLEPEDDRLRPVLVDFGLVKDLEEESDSVLTAVGAYMGTPTYMSPEQSRGEARIDGRVDIYALGCVMFKMVTGGVPYRARSALALAMAHAEEPIPALADRGPLEVYDEAFEGILRKCLAKKPEDRWPDAGQLADALEAWMRGDVVPTLVLPSEVSPSAKTEEPPPAKSKGLVQILAVVVLGLVGLVSAFSLAFGVWWSTTSGGAVPEASLVVVESVEELGVDPAPVSDENAVADPELDVPAQAPAPMAEPAPAPTSAPVAPKPAPVAPKSAPVAPKPAPKPAPSVASSDAVVDGVFFSAAHASRAVAFLNSASEEQLRTAGVYGRGVGVILNARPFADIQSFGATPQVGEKTVQAIHRVTEAN